MTAETDLLYQTLLKELQPLGTVVTEEKKTSIHLKHRTAFAGVHPRKNWLILNIVSSSAIDSPRVFKREQVSRSRFHNEIKIERPGDIDKEVLDWLADAYALTA